MTQEEIIKGNKLIFNSPFDSTEYDRRPYGYNFYANVLRYHTDIAWLWPVLGKIREAAQANQPLLLTPWLAVCMELYKVPEDITELYKTVIFFITTFNGAVPDSTVLNNG